MRWLSLVVFVGGCHEVFDLDRSERPTFCAQNADAVFCADFDDNEDDPLAAFSRPDESGRYSAEADDPHSPPFAARMTIESPDGSPDARMQRQLDAVGDNLSLSMWLNIAEINRPTLQDVKLFTIHFGAFTNGSYERILYLTAAGNLIQKVGATFPRVVQLDAVPTKQWIQIELSVALSGSSGTISVDTDRAEFTYTALETPTETNRMLLTVGPHDPVHDDGVDVVMLYDDIVVRD